MTDQSTPHRDSKREYAQILERAKNAREELDEIIERLSHLKEEDAIANRLIHSSLIEVKIECDYCCRIIFDCPNRDS